MSRIQKKTRSLCSTNSLAASSLFDPETLFKIFKEIKVIFHDTPETWWESLWNHGTRAKFEQLTSDQINHLRGKVLQKASCLMTEGGIPEALQVFYGTAKNC